MKVLEIITFTQKVDNKCKITPDSHVDLIDGVIPVEEHQIFESRILEYLIAKKY